MSTMPLLHKVKPGKPGKPGSADTRLITLLIILSDRRKYISKRFKPSFIQMVFC